MGQTSTTPFFLKPLFSSLAFLLVMLLPAFSQAQVTVTVTGTNVTCFGYNNGTATATPSGGWFPYTYLWSNGATTQTITNLAPGTYCVTVTDIDLGTGTGCITITQPTQLGAAVYGESVKCSNVPDGKAGVTPSGGTPPYSYLWSNGGVTPEITGLAAGTYTVTVTDAHGCTVSGSYTVEDFGEGIWLMIVIDQQIKCFGGSGTFHVAPMSGSGNYTYDWSNDGPENPDNDPATLTNMPAGTYTVTVTDVVTGCTAIKSVTTTQPPVLVCSPSSIPANCGLNGSATISASGGTGPYTYLWSNGQNTPTVSVAPGTYTATVTDANGCTCSSSITVTSNNNALTVNTSPTSNAGCTVGGSAQASAFGGSGNYSYTWSNGQTGPTATNLPVGTYTVTVVDIATGCLGTANVTIVAAPQLVPSGTANAPATCVTGGTATASATGGTPPYTFLWDNGQVTATATNLVAGQHSFTITDSKGCVGIGLVTIIQSQGPTASAVVNAQATCVAGGTATASGSGGSGNYTFKWSNPAMSTTATVTGLAPGTYNVTVTDSNGCSAVAMVTITQPGAPTASIASSTPSACNSNSGSATAAASGGTGNYTYKWSNAAMSTTATVNNLSPGTYTVTVTDANGCTATASVSIASSLPPNVVIVASFNANCSTPGGATASVSGGTGPFKYLWSSGETTVSAVNLLAGTHTVTVTDNAGCTATASVTIGSTNNGIKIGDYVWFDTDQNGHQHPTLENGVPNVTVMLIKPGNDGIFNTPDDVIVGTKITNAQGKYFFECVTPGTYILMFSGIPAGYEWTTKDVGNDCEDSDVKSNGKTSQFTITAGQPDDLCFDGGIHIVCENILHAGSICCNQTICEGETPALITSTMLPTGGSGPIEYVWMQFIQIGQGQPDWVGVPGAHDATYQPGPLFETTKFMRCARRGGCTTFLESNIIQITVLPAGTPGCDGFTSNLTVFQNGPAQVQVNWSTLPEATEYMYTVQHSTNMQNWTNSPAIMGKQDPVNANQYEYLHETPALGTNFYRIRRVSSMGQTAFSEIVSLDVQFSLKDGVIIAPNPVTNELRIMNAITYDADVNIDISATNGAVLHRITIKAGTMYAEKLPVQDLPSGIYIARVRFGNGESKTLKIVKI